MVARKIVAQSLSELFSIFSHPIRLRLIEALAKKEKDVTELQNELDLKQSVVSQQLSILRQGRIVKQRKEGKHIFYSLSHSWIAEWLLGGLLIVEERVNLDHEMKDTVRQAKDLWLY